MNGAEREARARVIPRAGFNSSPIEEAVTPKPGGGRHQHCNEILNFHRAVENSEDNYE